MLLKQDQRVGNLQRSAWLAQPGWEHFFFFMMKRFKMSHIKVQNPYLYGKKISPRERGVSSTMCIVHKGFRGFRAASPASNLGGVLIGLKSAIPYDTIHSTLCVILKDNLQ